MSMMAGRKSARDQQMDDDQILSSVIKLAQHRDLSSRSADTSQSQTPGRDAYVRLVLDSLGVGYLCVDRNYAVTSANAVALSWLGLRSADVIGRPFANVAPRSPMRMLKNAVERSIFVDRQLSSYGKPGRWLDMHVYPTQTGAIVFFRDLTRNKQCQRQEAAKDALFRALDVLETQVLVLDRQGTVIASNRAWQEFAAAHGLTPLNDAPFNYLALRSKSWAHQSEAKEIAAALSAILVGSMRAVKFEYAWHLSETARSFVLRAERFDIDGEPYLVVTNDDVTALREAHQATAQLCERLLVLQEEERQRIAGELHDSTAQHLVAASLNLQKLRSRTGLSKDARSLCREMEMSLQEASKELRAFTYLLHPPQLTEQGLITSLEHYVQGFGRRTGLQVVLRTTPSAESIPPQLRRCVYRIVQEGLSNVHRHASATRVRVDVRCLGSRLHLIVIDDGCGIKPDVASSGVGLPGIGVRLRQLGGRLDVTSSSRGTRLHAVIPLAEPIDDTSIDSYKQEKAVRARR